MDQSDSPTPPDLPWDTSSGRRRVILLASGDHRPDLFTEAERLKPVIEQHADIVLTDLDYRAELSDVDVDFAIVLGGDGSILRAAYQMQLNQIPVLGVNLGRLGFLADLLPDELGKALPEVCRGNCRIVEHLMFRCSVTRGAELRAERLGLNETSILNGPPFSLVSIDLYVDAELATTYSCDGLIISTPVGSTAHNLSAGGPILRKNLQAFVISPISPHMLSVRPVVDTADRVFEMVAGPPAQSATVVVDGRVLCTLSADDRVRVERAEPKFKLIEVPGHSYYRTLREKLGWGEGMKR